MKARVASSNSSAVRQFTVPEINFKTNSYHQLINWQKVEITEPPLIIGVNSEELLKLVQYGSFAELSKSPIFQLPCHTQSVERTVKLVTEVSRRVADEVRRDGYIRAVLKSRAEMPTFTRKNDFSV